MLIAKKSWRWYWMPATGFLIGMTSILLLLWVGQISKSLRMNEKYIDAILNVQLHATTAHIRLEELIRGESEVNVELIMVELDNAIHLTNVILNGGEAKHKWIEEPLKDPEMRVYADAIRALLIKYKTISIERLQETAKPQKSSANYQLFHMVFNEVLSKSKQLEDNIEKEKSENQQKASRLFIVIPAIWMLIVVTSTAGLWSREQHLFRSKEDLLKANYQLLSQAEELKEHRQNLAELVDAGTAELAGVNERLRAEVAERQQAEAALKDSESLLRLLSTRLMTAQETERKHISRELHDELGHALTIMKLRMKSIERVLPGDAEIRKDCKDLVHYIDLTIEDVRRISRELSPTILEDLGLTAALRWLVDNFKMNFNGNLLLEVDNIDHLFSEDHQIMIYRVLQEALTNIGKHASPGNVSIVIRKNEGSVFFLIEDDGKGFHPSTPLMRASAGKGMGLSTMRERVRMMGGSLEITSEEGKGTRISFTIALRKE